MYIFYFTYHNQQIKSSITSSQSGRLPVHEKGSRVLGGDDTSIYIRTCENVFVCTGKTS